MIVVAMLFRCLQSAASKDVHQSQTLLCLVVMSLLIMVRWLPEIMHWCGVMTLMLLSVQRRHRDVVMIIHNLWASESHKRELGAATRLRQTTLELQSNL